MCGFRRRKALTDTIAHIVIIEVCGISIHGAPKYRKRYNWKNRLDVGTLFRHVDSYESGKYPEAMIYHFSASCNHCENPACVDACLMRCLEFGDLDELTAKHGADLVNMLPFMADSALTNLALLIKPKKAALAENYRKTTI